jgi:hypothetical protein
MRLLLTCLTLLSTVTTLPAAEPARIKVLIVDGCSNHDWQLTTRCIRAILEPTGLFEVTVATAPPTAAAPGWDAWRPRFRDHDVVIQHYNDLNGGAPWPAAVRTDFEDYVRNGGGLYVWHAGNNAFPDWPAYNQIIGLGWRKKDFGPALVVGEDETIRRIPAGEATTRAMARASTPSSSASATTRSTRACPAAGRRRTSRSTTTPAARRRTSRCCPTPTTPCAPS